MVFCHLKSLKFNFRALLKITTSQRPRVPYRTFYQMPSQSSDLISVANDNTIDLSNITAFREPEFIFVNGLFAKYGYEIRVAGGAVRDILMKKEPKDIDLATTATPTQMIEMFTKEELRILNRNGESHGTVTVRINDKVGIFDQRYTIFFR